MHNKLYAFEDLLLIIFRIIIPLTSKFTVLLFHMVPAFFLCLHSKILSISSLRGLVLGKVLVLINESYEFDKFYRNPRSYTPLGNFTHFRSNKINRIFITVPKLVRFVSAQKSDRSFLSLPNKLTLNPIESSSSLPRCAN